MNPQLRNSNNLELNQPQRLFKGNPQFNRSNPQVHSKSKSINFHILAYSTYTKSDTKTQGLEHHPSNSFKRGQSECANQVTPPRRPIAQKCTKPRSRYYSNHPNPKTHSGIVLTMLSSQQVISENSNRNQG